MKSSGTSVVIPTRNRLPLLREAITSSLQQEAVTQVVVVDDASDDGTWTWLSGIRIEGPRPAPGAPRRAGTPPATWGWPRRQATSSCSSTTTTGWSPTWSSVCRPRLERRPDAVLAMGVRLVFDERGQLKAGGHPPFRWIRTLLPEVLSGVGWVLRADAHPRAAPPRGRGLERTLVYAEDPDLLLRLSLLGRQWFFSLPGARVPQAPWPVLPPQRRRRHHGPDPAGLRPRSDQRRAGLGRAAPGGRRRLDRRRCRLPPWRVPAGRPISTCGPSG